MKRLVASAMAALFVLGSGLTAWAIHETMPSETQVPEPGPDAGKLHEYITRHNPYSKWSLWPGKGRLYKGTEPHGSLLTTFVNPAAQFSNSGKKGMAEGSIIVKENYSADKTFVALTVMYKIKGYNPEAGDWFWAKYTPDGTVQASGRAKACIDCHSRNEAKDFIMTPPVAR